MKKTKILGIILFVVMFATVFGVVALSSETTVTVTGNVPYVDTSVDVKAGDILEITSSGYWCWASWEPGSCSGPDGSAPPYDRAYEGDLLVFTAPHGALVGRIGSGDWFFIGSNYKESVTSSGRLLLAANDNAVSGGYGDNTGSVQVIIKVTPSTQVPTIIPATIDCDPDTLNLKSKGNWITCYIELPAGYDVWQINGSTILLNGMIPAYLGKEGWAKTESDQLNIMDNDGDGVLERMVKFDRAAVQAILIPGEAILTLAGKVGLADFEGSDTIRVIK